MLTMSIWKESPEGALATVTVFAPATLLQAYHCVRGACPPPPVLVFACVYVFPAVSLIVSAFPLDHKPPAVTRIRSPAALFEEKATAFDAHAPQVPEFDWTNAIAALPGTAKRSAR